MPATTKWDHELHYACRHPVRRDGEIHASRPDGQGRDTGERKPLERLETLWFNTGSLCNIECDHCYIESSPTNVRLVYLGLADVDGVSG